MELSFSFKFGGERNRAYSHERRLWAKIEPIGSAIYYGSEQTGDAVTHRIWLRWRGDIDNRYEVLHHNRVYRVRRQSELNGEQRFLLLDVVELGHE